MKEVDIEWLACSARSSILALAPLRNFPEIRVAEHHGMIWFLFGKSLSPDRLPSMPCTYYFQTESGCVKRGESVPSLAPLPDPLASLPILEWWKLHVSSNALQQYVLDQTMVSLLPSSGEVKPNAMLSTFDTLLNYILRSSTLRSHGLQFALNRKQQVWIEGKLLPSIPGSYYFIQDLIATPLGSHWAPAVSSSVLRKLFSVRSGTRIILSRDKQATLIQEEELLPVTRANLRASSQAMELP